LTTYVVHVRFLVIRDQGSTLGHTQLLQKDIILTKLKENL